MSARLRQASASSSTTRTEGTSWLIVESPFRGRQEPHGERAATTDFAGRAQAALVLLQDGPGQRQPQAQAPRLGRVQRLRDPGQVLWRDAHARVADQYLDTLAGPPPTD